MKNNILHQQAIELLKQLIETPSLSKNEDKTAELLQNFLKGHGIDCFRIKNNIWAKNKYFDEKKPTILLNSHHDTVPPAADYTLPPYSAIEKEGKIFGLGSNDAGGCLVALVATFLSFYERQNLSYNIVLLCSAEEEISGKNGISSTLEMLPEFAFGIIGEPTQMKIAVAEKGLMVLDCTNFGKSGHAARDEGINAISLAIKDIEWLHNYQFDKVSTHLGAIKMTATVINAGERHNVVPEICHFVVDVRTTDAYTNEEILAIIQSHLNATVKARSTRLQPSFMPTDHPILLEAEALGFQFFGSSTLSDQALLSFPTIKLGPGDSARSHTANEYIYMEEIKEGIDRYINLIVKLVGEY